MTARPFAYNTGFSIGGTSQVGDLAVGIPSAGFSGLPDFWNGPNEELGYVIAYPQSNGLHPTPVPGKTSSVGFWRSKFMTNESFLALVLNKTGQTFATGLQAKTWLNNNGYWTSFPSPVVTADLVLRLDAGDPSSYSGSGSTWTDIAGTQQNVTLYNSPAYTSGTPAYFNFNGSNQYGLGSGSVIPTTAYTKSAWFYLNGYQDNNIVSGDGHFIYMGPAGSTHKIYCGHANWALFTAFPSSATISLNTWYNVTLTFNTTDGMKLYINGSLDSSYTANKSAHSGSGTVNIGTYNGGNLLNGRVSKVYCYNRSLTAQEVIDNFNSSATEFGYNTI